MTKRPHLQVDDETEQGPLPAGAELRLERALAATRRHFDGRQKHSLSAEHRMLTEQRILEHAWPVAPRRRPLLYLPLVALFAGSVAFAQELGALFDGARERFFAVDERLEVLEPAPRAGVPDRVGAVPALAPVPVPAPVSAPALAPEPEPERAALDSVSGSPASPQGRARVRESVPRVASTAASPSVATPLPSAVSNDTSEPTPGAVAPMVDEFALYREAHRAHFVDRNYASALTHWDRYLAAARHGSMAPEARYNRALALYHLGRRDEAAAALRPFAEGAYGRYRRDEARRLLESLEAR